MAGTAFDVEQLRQAAARRLPAPCHDDFLRLARTLLHGPAFQWLLVDAPDETLRWQVMAALDDVLKAAGQRSARLPLSDRIADVAMLEERLVKNAAASDVVHVIGRPGWFDSARWDAFNVRRERLSAQARARLVFWLDAEAIALASRTAPDLWAWRGGVYAFRHAPVAAPLAPALRVEDAPLSPRPEGTDQRSMAERSRRVAEIRAWLAAHPDAPDDLLVAPMDELGRLLFDLGDDDAALQHWREAELPLARRQGDARAEAITQGQIADVLTARGQLDEAMRIRQHVELPTYARLGDMRERAVTLGKMASILTRRGQLDEALRIHREEQLPVFEQLGDLGAKAVTLGQIADILVARGQLDEALHIRHAEQQPMFDRLGDARGKAISLGKIADILHHRGQLEEALRIHQEDQLPVFERLGDVRERAQTLGRIADILQDRGQHDEALHIRQTEQLPVYARLGDLHGLSITKAKIGMQLLDRDEAAAVEGRALLAQAHADLSRMGVPEAETVARIMREHGLDAPAPLHPPQ